MGVFAYVICLRKLFFFALQALLPLRRCPFFLSDFFGSHAPRVFPSALSLPSEGRDGGGRSRDALVLLPEGFPLLPLDLVQWEGWRSLWSRVRCTQARFCLLGSFVDWGSRSCSLAADSCYLFCPGWFSLLISARSARWWGGRVCRVPLQLGPPWPPDLRLGKSGGYFEPALGQMALVCDLLAHAVSPLAVLGSTVGTLWAWIVSFAVFHCVVAVRSLAVYGPLTVSQHSL